MARTVLTPITGPLKYASAGIAVTWTAADVANGNRFLWTGKEILLAKNVNAGTQVVTVQGENDPYGRDGTQVITMGIGSVTATYAIFGGPFPNVGWVDSGGYINVDGLSADVSFAVIKLDV